MTIGRSSAEASIYTNMSVNSSYFDDPLDPPSPGSPNNSSSHFDGFVMSFYVLFAAVILYTLLLLPLIILVLYLGFQKSRKPRSSSTATSHSDHFTYHSTFLQLIELLGFAFYFISTTGIYFSHLVMMVVGQSLLIVTPVGQALFHLLTCVERYLAVVHPVTYLGLRQGGGVRIRNISIGCVWFLSFGYLAVMLTSSRDFIVILGVCFSVILLCVPLFCSIPVLYVLKRPGPGEGGGTRERVDQSKQRAFYSIMAIMGALLLRFGGDLIVKAVMYSSTELSFSTLHVVILFSFWSGLPSGLILPLLFLRGAGKLQCCKQNTESG